MTLDNSIGYRVAPVTLPKVKDDHLRGVFGNFEEVIRTRIAELRATPIPLNAEKARFFEYLLREVNAESYGRLQDHHLGPAVLDPASDIAKYIDPTIWFESKLVLSRRMNLDTRPPMKILDLGTGPGHFPVVARFYGHDVTGTDLPPRAKGIAETGHLYDALCDIYKVRRIPHMIHPFEELPSLNGPYDLVTAFLAAFNVDEDKKPWSIQAWTFFLRSLKERVLSEKGELFMTLANNKLTDEVWAFLASRAAYSQEKSKQIHFTDFSTFQTA